MINVLYENCFYGHTAGGGFEFGKNYAGRTRIVAVYTQPDRPSGRGNKLAAPPVKDYASRSNLKVLQPTKIKTSEALETFKSHDADIVIVVAYGRILPETFLQAFPKGAINVHFSLLPKYRGAAPVNWAIVNGETKTGVTTMQMDAGLDTGGILLQRETKIREEETAVELMNRLAETGADTLSETLAMYDELTIQPQNEQEASYAPIMKKDDGLIDWKLSASGDCQSVRGFQPFPTSFTKYQDKKLTIWKAKPVIVRTIKAGNGLIIEAKGDKLYVRLRKPDYFANEELQIEGKKRMATRDFLNGG